MSGLFVYPLRIISWLLVFSPLTTDLNRWGQFNEGNVALQTHETVLVREIVVKGEDQLGVLVKVRQAVSTWKILTNVMYTVYTINQWIIADVNRKKQGLINLIDAARVYLQWFPGWRTHPRSVQPWEPNLRWSEIQCRSSQSHGRKCRQAKDTRDMC